DVWSLEERATAPDVSGYDVVHALHAYRTGRLLLDRLGPRQALVVTFTGTDLNEDLDDPVKSAAIHKVVARAGALTVYHQAAAEQLSARIPAEAGKIRVISPAPTPLPIDGVSSAQATSPQSTALSNDGVASLPATSPQSTALSIDGVASLPVTSSASTALSKDGPLSLPFDLPETGTLFLLPAGVRRVKNVHFPLRPLSRLVARGVELHLLIAGPVLEETYYSTLQQELLGRPWARYVGEVDHQHMGALFQKADVVLNTSISEGLSNVLLEAMSLGRAVLASDIAGNRALIEHGATGLLYSGEEQFEREASRLAANPQLRAELGRRAQTYIATHFSAAKEIDDTLRLYQSLLKEAGVG